MSRKLNEMKSGADILKSVESIVLNSRDTKLCSDFFKAFKPETEKIATFFGISPRQAVLLSVIVNMSLKIPGVELDDLAGYFEIAPVSSLRLVSDLDDLVNKKILCRGSNDNRHRNRRRRSYNGLEYTVPKGVMDALLHNKPILIEEKKDAADIFQFMEKISNVFEDYHAGENTFIESANELRMLMDQNCRLPFVNAVSRYNLQSGDLALYLLLCKEFIESNDSIELPDVLKFLFPDLRTQIRERKAFLSGNHELLRSGLVEMVDNNFRDDHEITLTRKSAEMIFQDEPEFIESGMRSVKDPNLVPSARIPEKKLYLSDSEQKSITFLTDALIESNLIGLKERLSKAKMKTGVTALLYGAPGTGKTESAYQLAKATGRDIWMVDISQTKDKFYGESEKLVKGIFDRYRKLCRQSALMPILLFNEADGVLSKRRELGISSVDQTQNAIQNILLQEMEDFEGILIATTNLTTNLDKAFERRFLYKIRFEKPSIEARVKIWCDKIEGLSENDALRLATEFPLSGGQIENVAKKCLMKYVICNETPSLSELCEYSAEELMQQSQKRRIGYLN